MKLNRYLRGNALVEPPDVTRELRGFFSMPPKPTTLRRALSLLQNDTPFVCAACRHRQAFSTFNGAAKSQSHCLSQRHPPRAPKASTIAPVTAVNAQRDIPSAYQALHESLSALEHGASVYANLSQLKLALRGLETEDAVTRVAGLPTFCSVLV